MPAPKVASVDAFFARLGDTERPHLETLRALSLAEAKKAGLIETLKWNFPAYTAPNQVGMLWTLQAFKNHCSVRFPVHFFASYREEVEALGYDALDGALRLRWDREVPKALITKLLRARIRDFEAGNTAWSEPKPRAAKSAQGRAAQAKR